MDFEDLEISQKKDELFKAFGLGIKPNQKLSIGDWASRYVKAPRSSRSSNYNLDLTPWLKEPINACLSNDYSEVVMVAPVGSGKSQMGEFLFTYITAEKPQQCMIVAQTDNEAADWFTTGILPTLKACPLIDPFWPKKQRLRKQLLNLSHMNIYITGANVSGLQSKSIDFLFGDECWIWKPGLMQEARKRLHDRFNAKCVFVSQAGLENDDFDRSFKESHTHEYCFKCESCQQFHPYNFDNLKWNDTKDSQGNYIWENLRVSYICDCGHEYTDTPENRRRMADSAQYIPTLQGNPKKGHIGYRYNSLAVYWTPWEAIVTEFLTANQLSKKGNNKPLAQFRQKRLSLPWTELQFLDSISLNLGGYTLAEANDRRSLYDVTLLTVDVQLDEFWFVVRSWNKVGESMLVEFGKLLTFSDILRKKQQYKLPNNCVFIDSAYKPEEVKAFCAQNQIFALNGTSASEFLITPRSGKPYKRIFGVTQELLTTSGKCLYTPYSSSSSKDIVTLLKQGNGAEWLIADDVSDQYKSQLNSEVKKQTAKGFEWIQVKADNHAFDCEVMQLIAAQMHKCFPQIISTEEV